MTRSQWVARAWRTAIGKSTTVASIARRLEPRLRKRFLAAVAKMKGPIRAEELAAALARLDASGALAAMHPERWVETLTPTAQIVPIVFAQSARQAAQIVSQQLRAPVSFDATNPSAVQWAKTQSARLITEVADSVKDAVRQTIGRAFTDGIPPRPAARLIRDLVGLTTRQAEAVMTYRTELSLAGRSIEEIAKFSSRYATQLLNRRALTIARTETMTSSLAGQQELWTQAVDKGLLKPDETWREFIVADDERLCERCGPMDGQIVPLGAPFLESDGTAVGMPPLVHPNCRCTVGLSFVGPDQAEAHE